MKKLILLTFILSSCSMFEEPEFNVDPSLQATVIAFKNEAMKRGCYLSLDDIIVRIGDVSSTGLFSIRGKQKFITINRAIFNKDGFIDSLALNYIVFHEFGHYMGRGHNESYSIMNPNKYAGDFHNDFAKRKLLIDELFNSEL